MALCGGVGGVLVQRKSPGTPGGAGHVGLTHTETQRGRLWTGNTGRQVVDGKHRGRLWTGNTERQVVDGKHREAGCGRETQGGRLWTGNTGRQVVDGKHREAGCGRETQGGRLWTGNTGRQVVDGKHREAGCGRPEDGGVGDSKNSQTTPGNNQHNPRYANYWAPLTRKRHIPPHPAQPRHTNHWAPRTRQRHQREHRAAAADRTQRPDATCEGKNG